uniref:Uncharacterized protein n=1 Tax=Magallana gigas TaxID=29159 RepID=A0A8W8IZ56_MAGGI
MKCILLIDPSIPVFQYSSIPVFQYSSIAVFSIQGSQPLEKWNHHNQSPFNYSTVKIHQLWPVLHRYTDGWFCEPTEAAITDQPISDIQKLKYNSM